MAIEIERKFLLNIPNWKEHLPLINPVRIKQGYLSSDIHKTVRVRTKGNKGFLTIKGKTENMSRQEFEYEIPIEDAEELLKLCTSLINKTRYHVYENGLLWEIDEFYGDNEGLVIVEVELESENQEVILPKWLGAEVTEDTRYYNAALCKTPYKCWQQTDL